MPRDLVLESKVQILWKACQDTVKKFHEAEKTRRLPITEIRKIESVIDQVDAYLGEYGGFVYRRSEAELNKPAHFHSIEILHDADEDTASVIRDRMKDLSELGWKETKKDVWEWRI